MINRTILFIIQSIHWIYIVLCTVSIPLIVVEEPFWISVPLIGWVMYLGFSRVLDCPWTRLENHYRIKVGKKPIRAFIRYNLKKLK